MHSEVTDSDCACSFAAPGWTPQCSVSVRDAQLFVHEMRFLLVVTCPETLFLALPVLNACFWCSKFTSPPTCHVLPHIPLLFCWRLWGIVLGLLIFGIEWGESSTEPKITEQSKLRMPSPPRCTANDGDGDSYVRCMVICIDFGHPLLQDFHSFFHQWLVHMKAFFILP